jgi:hypothetical protein
MLETARLAGREAARGEQGRGVAVDLDTMESVERAIECGRSLSEQVLVESYPKGDDLRLIVIGFKLSRPHPPPCGSGGQRPRHGSPADRAAEPAPIRGDRWRSRIRSMQETERCVGKAGFAMEDVPPEGPLSGAQGCEPPHGGTIHDVTSLGASKARRSSGSRRAGDRHTVVGVDFIVKNPAEPDYVFIEANERPGLPITSRSPRPSASSISCFR